MKKKIKRKSKFAKFGKRGGVSTSEAKAAAARANGQNGGRPRKTEAAP